MWDDRLREHYKLQDGHIDFNTTICTEGQILVSISILGLRCDGSSNFNWPVLIRADLASFQLFNPHSEPRLVGLKIINSQETEFQLDCLVDLLVSDKPIQDTKLYACFS